MIISKEIKPDYYKVKAIQAVANPNSVREMGVFIGMCSYYRRIIPDFSLRTESLINLTREYAFFPVGRYMSGSIWPTKEDAFI